MSKISNPLVTIITVVYNGEKYLQQTIDSVVKQEYDNIEYIIIDGGSTDGTLDIIKQNEAFISKWISEPDKGLYDAMNKGIKMAQGELIGMINSDDWYETDAVSLVVKAYIDNPSKHIFHADRYDILDSDERKLRRFNPSVFKFKYYGMTYNHPSMFITTAEYKIHKYALDVGYIADYQFVLEALLRDPEIFLYIDNAYVNYRLDGISAQQTFMSKIKAGYKSRKNARMSFIENLFSVFIRILKRFLKSIFHRKARKVIEAE